MQTQLMPQTGGAPDTFSCSACGYSIPNTMPAGIRFPCPGCQAPLTSPGGGWSAEQAQQYQQWALQNANAAASLAHQNAVAQGAAVPHDDKRANFSLTSEQILVRDAQGRRLVIGSHVDESRRWALRAQDATNGTLVWESPRTLDFSMCPDRTRMGVRASILLVANAGHLHAFDVGSGRSLWNAALYSDVETLGDCDLPDELDVCFVTGVVVVHTKNERVTGIDAQTGSVLWQREADARPVAVGDFGLFLRWSDGIEVLDPRSGNAIAAHRGGGFDESAAFGGQIVVEAEQNGVAGFCLVEAQSGRLLSFSPAPGFDLGYGGEVCGRLGRFVVAQSTEKGNGYLYVVDPAAAPPKPGFFASLFGGAKPAHVARRVPGGSVVIDRLRTSDDAICIEAIPEQGGPTRVLVLDPQTLATRHDSGPIPFDESDARLTARGPFAAYVIPTSENHDSFELRVVWTANGQLAFSRNIGRYRALYFDDDGLVVHHDTSILLLCPNDGALIASYPHA